MKSINPYTNELIQEYSEFSPEQVEKSITDAHSAFLSWRRTNFEFRSHKLKKVSEVLIAGKADYGKLISDEMGKPLSEAIKEVEKCAWVCHYYADNASEFLKNEKVITDYHESFITHCPLGVILAIMPWNFPFWQVFRFAAPSLMAGNTAILKHASNVSGSALAIESIFQIAGLEENVFKTILVSSAKMESVIANPLIKAVTLTGSTEAGKKVAQLAGAHLKKSVLELGGSDPYIILRDANLDRAATTCVNSRLLNCGQSCISAKRFIVVEEVYDEFLAKLHAQVENIHPGDPQSPETRIGPMARLNLRDELHSQVELSQKKGANCTLGGKIPKSKSLFYPPTILTDVVKGMPAYDEELFGPVFSIIKVKDTAEALAVAADTKFGLGAAIFSQDIKLAAELATNDVVAGTCAVNDFVRSDPRLPFGGVKNSGYGRELSHYGIKEFVNIKTVCVAKD